MSGTTIAAGDVPVLDAEGNIIAGEIIDIAIDPAGGESVSQKIIRLAAAGYTPNYAGGQLVAFTKGAA